MRDCSISPAEKTAEAEITICPLTEIQPVAHEAINLCFSGARTATQWYWPAIKHILAVDLRSIYRGSPTAYCRIYRGDLGQ